MTNKDTGGSAFPFGQTDSISGQLVNGWGSDGMTLRDYFAAKAMQAFLQTAPSGTTFGTHHNEMNDKYARASYSMADSMLKERK